MKVSACLIVKNESANIARCLQSLHQATDEIIVVDTGSTDDTVSIAESFNAKVLNYPWDNNFSNARNLALANAKGEWIIFLDADEYLEEKTQAVLLKLLHKIHPIAEYEAINCRMVHTDGFNGKVISENPVIRFFRNDPSIRYEGAVHEKLLKNGEAPRYVTINDLDLIVYHTGYRPCTMKDKFERNLSLLKEQEETKNIDYMTYYYLCSTHYTLGNHQEAVRYALLAIKEPVLKRTILAHKPYVLLVLGMLTLKEIYRAEDIERYADEALKLFPNHPECWYAHAMLKKEQEKFPDALESYKKALECNKKFDRKTVNDMPLFLEKIYSDLGYLSSLSGNAVGALEYYHQGLLLNKYNQDAFNGLIGLIGAQRTEEVVYFLNSIYNRDEEKDLEFLTQSLTGLNEKAALYYHHILETRLSPN